MKRYDVRMSCLALVILALVCAASPWHATMALAAGPDPASGLGQSTQPTSTHQVFAPVVSGGGGSSPDASVPASSTQSLLLLGALGLVVLIGAYLLLQMSRRGK